VTDTLKKASVTLGGVPLAGSSTIVWKFTTGVHPYITTMSVHTETWEKRLKAKKGGRLQLVIINSYGNKTTIEDLYILHETPNAKPKMTSFLVADRRWRWDRTLIVRDYNISKRTGDKNFDNKTIPIDNKVTTDKYDYRPYSLHMGEFVWRAQDCLEDILEQLEGMETSGTGKKQYKIDSIATSGEFTVQNISISDQGNLALQRVLSFIPGTQVYVDKDGMVKVFNGLDMDASDTFIKGLPPSTWDGDKHELIDRVKIRPTSVNVYYEREIETLIKFEDDWSQPTSASPIKNSLECENVIPTVYEKTEITEWDYEENKAITRTVPPGTWVNAKEWLFAHNKVKPTGSLSWNFETLRTFWLAGDLEGRLGGTKVRGSKIEDKTNVLQAIQVLKEHFRQTFRISRRYMERIRDIKPVRVASLDPVTGTRMPASVWGQMTVGLTTKGTLISSRKNPQKSANYYLINSYPDIQQTSIIRKDPGPQRVTFLDRDVGIFRITADNGTYGTYNTLIPGFTSDASGKPNVPIQDLAQQDDKGVSHGAGMRLVNGTNEFLLPYEYKFKMMVTIVPGSPNSKNRMHVEPVTISEIQEMFDGRVKIQEGHGQTMDVFVPAGEITARYAWTGNDELAEKTMVEILGLDDDDPTTGGIRDDPKTKQWDEGRYPIGFTWVNEDREVMAHSRAVAAEAMSPFVDGIQGRITTRSLDGNSQFKLVGNMSGISVQVDGSPSAKVRVTSEFAGMVNPISRLALMPETARKVVLGIVRFSKD